MKKRSLSTLKRSVWSYYKKHGRHDLPWRKTKNPYHILVSEIMLQQTQVSRVIPKYTAFLKRFPTVESLAGSPLRDVLVYWQGLGYNRRAKFLHECAREVAQNHKGKLPVNVEALSALPGIGPYTAGAVCVFSQNMQLVMIETNIRTVFLHHLFPDEKAVSDKTLLTYIEKAVTNETDPRLWYWALMDYGSYLKSQGIRTHRNSKHYTKQSTFKGSDREVRGAILRILSQTDGGSVQSIVKATQMDKTRIQQQLLSLKGEGLVNKRASRWFL